MSEKTMRKWGAWAAAAILAGMGILTIAPDDAAEAKGNAALQSPVTAADSGARIANADSDTLDLQLD